MGNTVKSVFRIRSRLGPENKVIRIDSSVQLSSFSVLLMAPRGVGEWITQSSPVPSESDRVGPKFQRLAGLRPAVRVPARPVRRRTTQEAGGGGACIHPLREREFFSLFRGIGDRPGWDADTPQAFCMSVCHRLVHTRALHWGTMDLVLMKRGAAATCFWNNHVWVLGSCFFFLAEAEVCGTVITST